MVWYVGLCTGAAVRPISQPPGNSTVIRTARLWGIPLVLLAAFGTARADSYYMVVFGAQSMPQLPRYSHSWATFVRIPSDCGCGRPADAAPVEWFTISWLPCKVELTPNTPFAEPGRNFD